MTIKDLQKNWNGLAELDPFWAILTDSQKRGGKWDKEEFFRTGVNEINLLMEYLKTVDVEINRGKALDFGCGAGRLTQALAEYFDQVVGVDVSEKMLDLAQNLNVHGENCVYIHNLTDELRKFEDDTFDFIYSNIVLQHMAPRYSKKYVREFGRVAKKGGVVVFQIPGRRPKLTENVGSVKELAKWLIDSFGLYSAWQIYVRFKTRSDAMMYMYHIKQEEVIGLIGECKMNVVDVVEDNVAGMGWASYRYCCSKK